VQLLLLSSADVEGFSESGVGGFGFVVEGRQPIVRCSIYDRCKALGHVTMEKWKHE
jgi:hypothetical protein